MDPVYFTKPDLWRKWLEKNHGKRGECLVGFHKVDSGRPSIDWNQAVDEALCFGWIDGIRKSLGPSSYTIRFTPRKASSTWSAKNIKRALELIKEGRMQASGLAAFQARKESSFNLYSFEQKAVALDKAHERIFRANPKAWKNFQAMGAYYIKAATWWVISAKQEATRLRRLATLIADSEKAQKVPPLRPPSK